MVIVRRLFYIQKRLINNMSKKEATEKLRNLLERFLEKHKLCKDERNEILKEFDSGEYLRPIDVALGWRCSENSYVFYYLLQLRWLEKLIELYDVYSEAFESLEAIKSDFSKIYYYTDGINEPYDEDSFKSFNYETYKMRVRYYRKRMESDFK